MKLEFSRHLFAKYSIINFVKNGTVEADLFHADRRTERHDETSRSFSQFCERA